MIDFHSKRNNSDPNRMALSYVPCIMRQLDADGMEMLFCIIPHGSRRFVLADLAKGKTDDIPLLCEPTTLTACKALAEETQKNRGADKTTLNRIPDTGIASTTTSPPEAQAFPPCGLNDDYVANGSSVATVNSTDAEAAPQSVGQERATPNQMPATHLFFMGSKGATVRVFA